MSDNNVKNKELPMDRAYVWCIVGRPNSGKTHCVKSLMYDYHRNNHFKFGRIYTQNKMNTDLGFVEDKHILEYDEKNLEDYINKLMSFKEKTKQDLPPSFIIFDDCIGSSKLNLYSDVFSRFLILHRHLNISIFLTAQYLGGKSASSTLLRECCNYSIMFNTKFHNSIDFLYKFAGGWYKKKDEFIHLLNKSTREKNNCLFYDNQANTIEDAYKQYKAPKDIPEFLIKF